MINLTTADISDSAGAQVILEGIRKRWPWVKHLFADGGYDRLKLMSKADQKGSKSYLVDGWLNEPSVG